MSPLWGYPWNFTTLMGSKTRMTVLTDQEKRLLIISSSISIQYTSVTDRRTDRQTDGGNGAGLFLQPRSTHGAVTR